MFPCQECPLCCLLEGRGGKQWHCLGPGISPAHVQGASDPLRVLTELCLTQVSDDSRDSFRPAGPHREKGGNTPTAGGLPLALCRQPWSPADAPPSMPTPWEASDT